MDKFKTNELVKYGEANFAEIFQESGVCVWVSIEDFRASKDFNVEGT